MFCSSCGKELVGQSSYCENCGAAVEQSSSPSVEQDSPPSLDNREVSELEETQRPKAPRIGFRNAVKLGLQNAFNFKTRSSRAEYWWFELAFWLALVLALFVAVPIANQIGGIVGVAASYMSLSIIYLVVARIALQVRRLHDLNMSGWYFLLMLIPMIGWAFWLFICFSPSYPKENRWRRLH